MALPKTMKAARYEAFSDDTSSIQVVDIDVPAVGDDQVLVKVAAASINPIDGKVFRGYMKDAWVCPLPLTPGYDLSGTVAAVGSKAAESFSVGDEVFACNWGTGAHHEGDEPVAGAFAEFAVLPARKVSKKPAGLEHAQAAAVALVGLTAKQALTKIGVLGDAPTAKRVLILGGSGAVGMVAVQLAKLAGASFVATTCSARTMELVQSLGPDKIINYREAEWSDEAELKGIDAVFDTMGEADGFARAKKILKPDGSFVSIASLDAGFDPSAHAPLTFASFYCLANSSAEQDELAQLMADGKLKLPIEDSFDFSEAGVHALFAKQDGGKSVGKNVLLFK